MNQNFFCEDPMMKQYFASLPGDIQSALIASGISFTTPGELLLCAEHLMQEKRQTTDGMLPRAADTITAEVNPE
jgi:hypothetical protein